MMVAFADLLRPDRPVNLSLIVLFGLTESREQHDRPTRSTPVRHPSCNITQPNTQFPDRPFQVIRPWTTKLGPFFRQETGHLVNPFEIAVTQVVEPLSNLGLNLKAIRLTRLRLLLRMHITQGSESLPTATDVGRLALLETSRAA